MLTDETISQNDYDHAQQVWKSFNCKPLGGYHDLYLKTDVVLLAGMDAYKLHPLHYYTAPGLSLDALLKQTKTVVELLADIDMHLFTEKCMRGGICMVSKRHAKANNPHTADYNPEKTNNFIMYYDANNLYGWAMSQPLPYSGFKWLTENEKRKGKFNGEPGKGWILEVTLLYVHSSIAISLMGKRDWLLCLICLPGVS